VFVLRGLRWCAVLGMGKLLKGQGLLECVDAVLGVGSNAEGKFTAENSMDCC